MRLHIGCHRPNFIGQAGAVGSTYAPLPSENMSYMRARSSANLSEGITTRNPYLDNALADHPDSLTTLVDWVYDDREEAAEHPDDANRCPGGKTLDTWVPRSQPQMWRKR